MAEKDQWILDLLHEASKGADVIAEQRVAENLTRTGMPMPIRRATVDWARDVDPAHAAYIRQAGMYPIRCSACGRRWVRLSPEPKAGEPCWCMYCKTMGGRLE